MKEDQFFEAFSQIDSKYIEDAKLHTIKRRVPVWLKILPLLLLLAAVLIYYSSGYYVYQEGEDYYIAFRGPRLKVEKLLWEIDWRRKHDAMHMTDNVYFESGSSVRSDCLNGKFTNPEMTSLRLRYLLQGPIKIPNSDELYDAEFPECEGYTLIWGSSLKYVFDYGDFANNIALRPLSQKERERFLSNYTQLAKSDLYGRLMETYTDETRNGTVYHFVSDYGDHTYKVVYEIRAGEKILYVMENYYEAPNTKAPADVYVLGMNNGIYFSLSINDPTERPSVEWLSSFGLKAIKE